MRRAILFFAFAFCFACNDEPMLAIRNELCFLKPASDAPDPSIPIGEKFAVVYRDPTFEQGKYGACELDRYSGISKVNPTYLPDERYADRPEELATVVLIETRKGPFIERLTAHRSVSRKSETNVHAGEVTIPLIDRHTNKIARRFTFTTRNIPKEVPSDRIKASNAGGDEYICEPTADEVRGHLIRLLSE